MSEQPITNVEDGVAALGALPVPSGAVAEPLSAEHLAQIEARAKAATAGPWCTDSWEIYQGAEYKPGLSFWIGETCRGTSDLKQDRADAAFVAAARSDVPALVAEVRRLLAERHSTNESLDDAAKALRADRDRIAELERVIADAPASYALMDRAAAVADRLTRTFAPTQALREDEPHDAGQLVEWCTGCNTDHDPDECGYRPESGGAL